MAKNAGAAYAVLLLAVLSIGYPSNEAPSPTPWSRWVEIDGALVHFIDTAPDSDLPVLLIVPGFLGSYATFEDLVGLLQPHMRVILPDLPGFGLSEVPCGACSLGRLIGFVEMLAVDLDLERFSLAGCSMGALVSIRLAIDRPDLVARLVLVSPFGTEGQAELAARIERLDPLLPLIVTLARRRWRIERVIKRQVQDPRVLTEEMIESYGRPLGTREGRRYVVGIIRSVIAGCTFDGCLPLLRQPVLVLAGSGDPLMDPATLRILDERIPHRTIHVLEHCRHLLYLDSPERVAGLLVEFCAEPAP